MLVAAEEVAPCKGGVASTSLQEVTPCGGGVVLAALQGGTLWEGVSG